MVLKFLPRRVDKAMERMSAVSSNLKNALIMGIDSPEYIRYFDHFVGDSAGTWPASANWGYPATLGTGTEVIALGALENGALVLTTGGSANDSAGQAVGLHWKGDNGFYFICKLKIDDITTSIIEVGLQHAVTGDTGAVDTKATPTFTSTNCALFVRDTTDDTNITFVSNGGSTDANADSAYVVANDTYFIVEIVGDGPTSTTGDHVTGYINGRRVGSGNINGATLITPYVYVETLAAATRTLTVDYMGCVGIAS